MKRKIWLCALLTLLFCSMMPARASAQEDSADVTLAPYFLIENAETSEDGFPLKETKVSTNINGMIAETYVTQTYANEGKNPINAKYIFPASTKVSVHGMKMQIGDQIVTAQIKEKEEAKQEFEQAKSEGKSASLMEEQRPNVFSMDVANIMPGDTVHIELHYTELISPEEGNYQFVFPTVTGPRYVSPFGKQNAENEKWIATPYLKEGDGKTGKYEIEVKLSAGVPITGLTCKTHKVDMDWENETAARITLSNPEEYAGNRDFILDYRLTGEEVNSGLMLYQGEKENFFLLNVQPPERCDTAEIPPREYIFVLDVSGSMYGFPLDTAKALIKNLVGGLRETDQFNLLLFSGAQTVLSPGSSLQATPENIAKAMALIDSQEGGGGTELAPALKTAINLPLKENTARSIVTITDGYIGGEKEIFELIDQNMDRTNFFSFGIGSSVNRYLIEGIAKAGAGESFVVTDEADALATADRFRTYIQSPVLTNIKIAYDGFDVFDVEPTVPSTLFASKPIVLFGKWKGEAAGTIRITGMAGGQAYAQDIPVSGIQPLEENGAIRYLWARKKVERLTDYGTNDRNEDVKKEVTQIGLDYSMMTPYTSFIAVVEQVRNPDKNSRDVAQPLPLPENVSQFAVGTGYTIGSEPGDMMLILMGAVLFFCVTGRRKKRTGRTA